jgi:hypothetical protein
MRKITPRQYSYIFLIIIAALFAVGFTSCISEKKRAKICASCPVITEVVTHETVTPFDTALYISKTGKDLSFKANDSDCCVLVTALYASMAANNGTITAKKDGIKSSIFKAKGVIVFRCEADSLKEIIKGLRTVKNTFKTETKVIEKLCELDHRKWLDELARKWLWLSLIILSAYGLFKFGPKLLKPF